MFQNSELGQFFESTCSENGGPGEPHKWSAWSASQRAPDRSASVGKRLRNRTYRESLDPGRMGTQEVPHGQIERFFNVAHGETPRLGAA